MDLGTIWASCISLHFPFWGQHNSELACAFQPRCGETSPMVRWFRHFHCRRPGSNPGQASKDPTCGNEHERSLCTATKTWYSQINKWINIFLKVCHSGDPHKGLPVLNWDAEIRISWNKTQESGFELESVSNSIFWTLCDFWGWSIKGDAVSSSFSGALIFGVLGCPLSSAKQRLPGSEEARSPGETHTGGLGQHCSLSYPVPRHWSEGASRWFSPRRHTSQI